MSQALPAHLLDFASEYPDVWRSFSALAAACHEKGGPLDERSRRIAKLAMAIGMRHQGAVHSAVRQALDAGISRQELLHVAILGITTMGWPAAQASLTWIHDCIGGDGGSRSDSPAS